MSTSTLGVKIVVVTSENLKSIVADVVQELRELEKPTAEDASGGWSSPPLTPRSALEEIASRGCQAVYHVRHVGPGECYQRYGAGGNGWCSACLANRSLGRDPSEVK